MGEEIDALSLSENDRQAFAECVRQETALLGRWLASGPCDQSQYVAGFELEAWLVDRNGLPVPGNERFLAALDHPFVVAELSQFNVEINGSPQRLGGSALSLIERELNETWRECQRQAHDQQASLVAIGILPTLREEDLDTAFMSAGNRYAALNQQIFAARRGRPIRLEIDGADRLNIAHHNVLLEAAATSFQVHFQAPAAQAARYYNASCIASAATVAISANSPYLFQCSLWDETRIPLFEQAVDTSELSGSARSRVTFGDAYLKDTICECFDENLARFAPLLPTLLDEPSSNLHHLRLHNGTIWRWNRPLVQTRDDGELTVRIEHRVMPAGPTIIDMAANAAFYIGLTHALANQATAPESELSFERVKANFYESARLGLGAEIDWFDDQQWRVAELIHQVLVPMAREGLALLAVTDDDIDRYMMIIAARAQSGQNGASWQREHVRREGRSFQAMLAQYAEHQRSGMPVHEWPA